MANKPEDNKSIKIGWEKVQETPTVLVGDNGEIYQGWERFTDRAAGAKPLVLN